MDVVQIIGIVAGALLVAILGFREFRWPRRLGRLGGSVVAVAALVVLVAAAVWIVNLDLRL